ncbi:MAG TPA: 4Fe-4S binding protein [Firmicutes bacterium]|nr:4Fe-4S binding protein [Bacillota bacterium]
MVGASYSLCLRARHLRAAYLPDTECGTAGRFFSIVTDLELEPTVRNYSEILDYCIKCSKCLRQCPVGALTESGKSNTACAAFLRGIGLFLKPRNGCGGGF